MPDLCRGVLACALVWSSAVGLWPDLSWKIPAIFKKHGNFFSNTWYSNPFLWKKLVKAKKNRN